MNKNHKSILKIIVIIIALIMNTQNLNAMEAYSDVDGDAVPVELPECFFSYEGCGNFSQNFIVRATLVDQEREMIEGTTPVEFYPINDWTAPYDGPSMITDRGLPYFAASAPSLDQWNEQDWDFVASDLAYLPNSWTRTDEVLTEIPQYGIYMGYDEDWDDANTYVDRRNTFMYYATNLEDSGNIINVPEIGSYVSFLDFFFKVSGFTRTLGFDDEWRSSYNPEINKIVADGQYYVLIEPVYDANIQYNYMDHRVRGTAKQLAKVFANSYDQTWYWAMYYPGNMYNIYCNFYDESGVGESLGLRYGYEWRCESEEHFNVTRNNEAIENQTCKNMQYYCSMPGYPNDCTYATQACRNAQIFSESVTVLTSEIKRRYEDLGGDTTVGVGIIDVSSAYGDIPDRVVYEDVYSENQCEYKVNLCAGKDFKFESKLDSSDIFHCVYPSDLSAEASSLEEVMYHIENTDLWCYDDVTYDFSDLRNKYYNNPILKTTQIALLPNGKMNVKRTCYSSNPNEDGAFNVLLGGTEPDGTKYKKNFTLYFNGEDHTYEVSSNRNITKPLEKNTEIPPNEEQEYYKYTAEFSYDIKTQKGVESEKASLNIFDNIVTKSLGNSNAIDIYEDYQGKINYISANTQEGVYYNGLRPNASTERQTGTIGDSYGLGNKLYNRIKDREDQELTNQTTEEYGPITYEKNTEVQHDNVITRYHIKNEYRLTRTTNPICTFETTIKNDKLYDDGLRFRVISLSNPFPARDGTSRIPGENWLSKNKNNVYEYIQNNRDVTEDEVYNKEPLYKITLTPSTLVKIREYNKKINNYKKLDLTCETGTGRMCTSGFIRNTEYLPELEGTCSNINSSNYYECADKTEKSGG